jgi:hypothetical protein
VIELHPTAIDDYRDKVADLQAALASDQDAREEAVGLIRGLVHSIDVVPLEGRGEVELRVNGILAQLINLATGNGMGTVSTVSMVAGEGPGHRPLRSSQINHLQNPCITVCTTLSCLMQRICAMSLAYPAQ